LIGTDLRLRPSAPHRRMIGRTGCSSISRMPYVQLRDVDHWRTVRVGLVSSSITSGDCSWPHPIRISPPFHVCYVCSSLPFSLGFSERTGFAQHPTIPQRHFPDPDTSSRSRTQLSFHQSHAQAPDSWDRRFSTSVVSLATLGCVFSPQAPL
jgi:hypothetical protein